MKNLFKILLPIILFFPFIVSACNLYEIKLETGNRILIIFLVVALFIFTISCVIRFFIRKSLISKDPKKVSEKFFNTKFCIWIFVFFILIIIASYFLFKITTDTFCLDKFKGGENKVGLPTPKYEAL